mmetsp:Transcript_23721/g.61953  ORF Transcript_23721/g.61953 Transcript_23721/m.61953 type:complete len:228 (-) Transcript_23721:123-806(-)
MKCHPPSTKTSAQSWLPQASSDDVLPTVHRSPAGHAVHVVASPGGDLHLFQWGVPATRAGMPTDRSASVTKTASPVHDELVRAIVCAGEYELIWQLGDATKRIGGEVMPQHCELIPASTAADMFGRAATSGMYAAYILARHPHPGSPRGSDSTAYGSTSLRKTGSGTALAHAVALRAAIASRTFSARKPAVMLGECRSDSGAQRCRYSRHFCSNGSFACCIASLKAL